MFEIVDRRRTDDDGRMPEHGYTISSPCEPNGSGELKRAITQKASYDFLKRFSPNILLIILYQLTQVSSL